MQTNFTPKQLQSPRIREADKILRRCVHCGLCTATCSTYVLLGDERDSPRGRIYLIKDMLENDRAATPEVAHHIDRCLSCLSCMTTCPGGVDYMHLVDLARGHIHDTLQRPLKDRLLRDLLAWVVPHPRRFRAALAAGLIVRPLRGGLRRIAMGELAAMLELAPGSPLRFAKLARPGTAKAEGRRRKRVALLAGCAQQVLRPEINDATVRLLTRLGVDVEIAADGGCCGALVHHMGKEGAGRNQARQNIDAWEKLAQNEPLDAIIINASGCGTTVKDYGHMLKDDPKYATKAAKVSELARDVTEFLSELDIGPPRRWSSLRVAYHSACSMQHGQRIHAPPRELLKQAGFALAEIPESHICCGSAGTYNILQPALATELRNRKISNIELTKPDLIAAGNIGCIAQIQSGTKIPIVHTVELLDWAYGGPVPRGIGRLAERVSDVREMEEKEPA